MITNPGSEPVEAVTVVDDKCSPVIYVSGDANGDGVKFGPKDEIRIPAGNSISVYVSAKNASVGGNGIINDTGVAKNFQYFGLPSNTTLSFSANAAFAGWINAPQADFSLGGGEPATLSVLDLAGRAGAPVCHVSTAFAHADSHVSDFFRTHAYERSKLEAEELVRSSGLSTAIVRPSIVIGDSIDGSMPRSNRTSVAASAMRAATRRSSRWEASDTPVTAE